MAFSHLVWEIANVFLRYLPNKKPRHSHSPSYDWLAGIVVNHSLDLTNKFWSTFLMKTIRMRIPSWCTFVITIGLIQFFSNSLHWHQNTLEFSYWSFWHECHTVQHAISKFLEEWIASWFYFLHSRQNLKQTNCMH